MIGVICSSHITLIAPKIPIKSPCVSPNAAGNIFGNRAERRRRVKKRRPFHVVKARLRPFYRGQATHPKICHRAHFGSTFWVTKGGKYIITKFPYFTSQFFPPKHLLIQPISNAKTGLKTLFSHTSPRNLSAAINHTPQNTSKTSPSSHQAPTQSPQTDIPKTLTNQTNPFEKSLPKRSSPKTLPRYSFAISITAQQLLTSNHIHSHTSRATQNFCSTSRLVNS